MDVEVTKISEKGQVVIPSGVRKDMGIHKADQFFVFGEGDTIVLKKVDKAGIKQTLKDIAEPLQRAAKQTGLTRKDVTQAIRDVRNA